MSSRELTVLLQPDIVSAYADSKATCACAEQYAIVLDAGISFFCFREVPRLNRVSPLSFYGAVSITSVRPLSLVRKATTVGLG